MPFNTALTGLQASSTELKVIGNNIANASTSGFKESRVTFADIYASSGGGNAIGSGVQLSSVTQQFSQGQVNFTNSNLDLAVSGQGFFVLSDSSGVVYSRAGAFGPDKDGYIVNAQNQRLIGFQADSSGNITGAQGALQISKANLTPQATGSVDVKVNLNAAATPPSVPFQPGFTPANPPDPASYTSSTSTTVYDSLGNSHILTTYFVKAPGQNAWNIFVGIDGSDMTPTAAATPAGPYPASYSEGEVPAPFTAVFDTNGNFVVHNASAPAQYYGADPVENSAGVLTNSGTITSLGLNQMTINGVPVDAASAAADSLSTSDASASAIATAAAINASTNLHGITAAVNSNVLNLGVPTLGDLVAGDLSINGIAISGVVASDANLLGLINAETASTGVVATQPGGAGTAIILTASDGRNIQMQTDGTTAGATFANFNLNGGAALDQTQRSNVSLTATNNRGITIGGASPGSIGFASGPQAGIIQTSSDNISIDSWMPTGAQAPQLLSFDFSTSTQVGAPFSVQGLNQDGYTTGRLAGVDVDPSGTIIARYSNGRSMAMGQVALANFGNVQGLSPSGNTSWTETFSSGTALIGAAGTGDLGVIQSGALEGSNVELTEQLVALIVAQRNFQANAQTIRTADAVQQTIINLR